MPTGLGLGFRAGKGILLARLPSRTASEPARWSAPVFLKASAASCCGCRVRWPAGLLSGAPVEEAAPTQQQRRRAGYTQLVRVAGPPLLYLQHSLGSRQSVLHAAGDGGPDRPDHGLRAGTWAQWVLFRPAHLLLPLLQVACLPACCLWSVNTLPFHAYPSAPSSHWCTALYTLI